MTTRSPRRAILLTAAAACLLLQRPLPAQEQESPAAPEVERRVDELHAYDVKRFGAVGDGHTSDTASINEAVNRCGEAGGGLVLFPPGRYLTGTIHLRSNVTLKIDAGATILASENLDEYDRLEVPDDMPESRWDHWNRGLFVGQGVENAAIIGPGTIDGNDVRDPNGEENMRGPHTIVFTGCKNMRFENFTVVASANYAVLFTVSDDCEFRDLKFVGGWDGIHWRGSPDRWCRGVDIVDCQFFTGDDSIAGRYWQDTLITGCIFNTSCNGIRLIGPAKNLTIHDNLFFGPGRQFHMSPGQNGRTNMLSGIILQPGGWDRTRGELDGVLLTDNTMRNVASPVTVINKRGNTVGRVTIDGLTATEVYRSAMSFESWADEPIGEVIVRDASVEYTGGVEAGEVEAEVRSPGFDARPLPTWGVYARNVESLKLQDVRVDVAQEDDRPVAIFEDVGRVTTDDFDYPANPKVADPVITKGSAETERSQRGDEEAEDR